MQKIKDFIYYNRKDIILYFIIIFLIIYNIFLTLSNNDFSNEEIVNNDELLIEKDDEIINSKMIVDIKGEIKNPNTYEALDGERIIDVINKAGGLTDKADVSNINLSEKVYDEMIIIIPSKESNKEIITKNEKDSVVKSDSKISINNASIEELMTLDGIGKTKAKNIVDFRNKNGKFKSIEEIKNVSGIGDALFEKIKNSIKV